MKPRIPITDPRFIYDNAVKTDIRRLFERVRKEQREAKQPAKVLPMRGKS